MPKALVVGGPHSGRTIENTGPVIILWDPPKLLPLHMRKPEAVSSIVKRQLRLECLHTPTKNFLFWVPEEQTPEQTTQALVDAYRRCFPE